MNTKAIENRVPEKQALLITTLTKKPVWGENVEGWEENSTRIQSLNKGSVVSNSWKSQSQEDVGIIPPTCAPKIVNSRTQGELMLSRAVGRGHHY